MDRPVDEQQGAYRLRLDSGRFYRLTTSPTWHTRKPGCLTGIARDAIGSAGPKGRRSWHLRVGLGSTFRTLRGHHGPRLLALGAGHGAAAVRSGVKTTEIEPPEVPAVAASVFGMDLDLYVEATSIQARYMPSRSRR